MSIKHKHYPHPVLEDQFVDSDPNFNNSTFNVSINYHLSDNRDEIYLDTTFDLYNETLADLIESKKAKFVLLLVCESSSIRTLVQTNLVEKRFYFSTKQLNKTVMIYPYILANKEIDNYRNSDLIPSIKNLAFEVKRGDILAIASNYELYIEKEALFDADSIFEFIELKRKNSPLLSYNPSHPKIQIFLPSQIYENVRAVSKYTGPTSDILISLLYLPAVIYSLQTVNSLGLSSEGEAHLLEYKDYNWYRTLEIKLAELKLGNDLSEIDEDKIIDVAHRLMEDPNTKALTAIENLLVRTEDSE